MDAMCVIFYHQVFIYLYSKLVTWNSSLGTKISGSSLKNIWHVLFFSSEGEQPWDFFGRNDAKAETPVLWSPHAKSWLIGKDSDGGKDWGQEEKGTTEDEMAEWHHWLDGRESWVNSGSWWWTGRPGVLQFMGSQRVGHDWATDLIWSDLILQFIVSLKFHLSWDLHRKV